MTWLAGQTITAGLLNDVTIQVTTVAGLSGLSPVTGMVAFCTDTLQALVYTGSVWVPLGAGLVADPVSTTSNGSATSGTTETLDSVLGVYQFSAVSGRTYEVKVVDLMCSCTVVADLYTLRIRNSGSGSTPTSSSTLVAQSSWECESTGGSGATTPPLTGTFTAASTGTQTLAFFAVRSSGTGVMTPVSGALARQLYVVDLGRT